MSSARTTVGALAFSALGLVALAGYESFRDSAYLPTPKDVPTIGFGSTEGVQLGQKITVERGLILLAKDVGKTEIELRACIGDIPMYQHEWDAYVSWAYNVGTGAACKSTLVKLLKEGKYAEACAELPKWNKQAGKELPGLTKRRYKEMELCLYGKR